MDDLLLEHHYALAGRDIVRYADEIRLDVERFTADLRARAPTPGAATAR